MPVTELALLRLSPSHSPSSIQPTLTTAKAAMETASSNPFTYLTSLTDPSLIYIVGGWPSIQFHLEHFIPSEENQEILKALQGKVGVEWMFHVGAEGVAGMVDGVEPGEVVGVWRVWVEPGVKGRFEAWWGQSEMEGRGSVVSGWRLDGLKDGVEEFVVLSRWEGRDGYEAFEAEGKRVFGEVGELVLRRELDYAKVFDVGKRS